MYWTYVDFKCCVRIHDKISNWYPMLCGIHQGGGGGGGGGGVIIG